jgi:hypothetical protein
MRLYDESITKFSECDFNGAWDENETVIFNIAPTENIVSIRQDLSPSLNPVNFQFITFDFAKYMAEMEPPKPRTPAKLVINMRGGMVDINPSKASAL